MTPQARSLQRHRARQRARPYFSVGLKYSFAKFDKAKALRETAAKLIEYYKTAVGAPVSSITVAASTYDAALKSVTALHAHEIEEGQEVQLFFDGVPLKRQA